MLAFPAPQNIKKKLLFPCSQLYFLLVPMFPISLKQYSFVPWKLWRSHSFYYKSHKETILFPNEPVGSRRPFTLVSLSCRLRRKTIATDFFNSLMRNVVNKGLAVELRNRNRTLDSLKAKNQFCSPQPWQLTSTMTATKYGIKERIRNSKMKKDIVANFLSICAIFNRRMSRSVELQGIVVCAWRPTRVCFFKVKNIPKYAKAVVERGTVVCKCKSIKR